MFENTLSVDSHRSENTLSVDSHRSENTLSVDSHRSENTLSVDGHRSENTLSVDSHRSENTLSVDSHRSAMHCTTKTNEKSEIVTQTTGTRSVAREVHGVGTNSLLLTDTVTGSEGPCEAKCENVGSGHESVTDAGSVYTSENLDTFTSSGTSEQKFEDDTRQTVSGTNGRKSGK